MKRRFDCVDFIGVHRISFQATLPKQEIGLSRVLGQHVGNVCVVPISDIVARCLTQ